MIQDETYAADALLDLAPPVPDKNDLDGNNSNSSGGGGGYAAPPQPFAYPPPAQNPPMYPQQQPYPYPPMGPPSGATAYPPPPQNVNAGPPSQSLSEKDILSMNEGPPPYFPSDPSASAPPGPTGPTPGAGSAPGGDVSASVPPGGKVESNLDLPELPTVPSDTPTHSRTPENDDLKKPDEDEDIDFDDLTRRFEALKKKK